MISVDRRALGGEPNPRQMEFFRARARYIAYGGARGGGKSWAVRTKCVMMAVRYPKIQILIMRRTLPELRENHILPLQELLAGVAKYNESKSEFVFPNGSRIRCGYCQAENDVYQYQGQSYDVIALEEATLFTESQFNFIRTCNRPSNAAHPIIEPRMYLTCNPNGVGMAWVKRLFVDREYIGKENPDDYVFIPARVYDNKYLMEADPEYVHNLETLPEHLRRAHLDGDWNVLIGQFFTEFRTDRHVVTPFELPEHWRRFRSMDWGYNDPCCVLWHAVSPDGRVYTYRELYVRWLEFGTFLPIFRSHGTDTPREPWRFGEEGSAEYACIRDVIALRYRLIPYISKHMKEASEHGTPVMRPLFYDFPEDQAVWDIEDEYMFGPDVLVAPVLYEGVRARELYLPKGSWININDQTQYFGGASVTADAPYEAIPVFVKQGSEAEKLLLS